MRMRRTAWAAITSKRRLRCCLREACSWSTAIPLSLRGLLRVFAKILVLNLLPNGRKVKPYGAGAVLFNPKPFLEDWAVLFQLFQEGKIRPVISGEFPLFEAARANALLESGPVVGNLVLVAPELQETRQMA
jgi:NADPH:quinone reductase-like Zn-dependent oxidoreductase